MFKANKFFGINSLKASTSRINPKSIFAKGEAILIFYCGPSENKAKVGEYGYNILKHMKYPRIYFFYKSDNPSLINPLNMYKHLYYIKQSNIFLSEKNKLNEIGSLESKQNINRLTGETKSHDQKKREQLSEAIDSQNISEMVLASKIHEDIQEKRRKEIAYNESKKENNNNRRQSLGPNFVTSNENRSKDNVEKLANIKSTKNIPHIKEKEKQLEKAIIFNQTKTIRSQSMNPKMSSVPDQNYTLSLKKEISTSRNIDNVSHIEKDLDSIFYPPNKEEAKKQDHVDFFNQTNNIRSRSMDPKISSIPDQNHLQITLNRVSQKPKQPSNGGKKYLAS